MWQGDRFVEYFVAERSLTNKGIAHLNLFVRYFGLPHQVVSDVVWHIACGIGARAYNSIIESREVDTLDSYFSFLTSSRFLEIPTG